MGTPGFTMNDGFMDVFKSCETHRQRSVLLLATISYLETGIEPEIPKGLQDKWRFIHALLVYGGQKASQNEATAKSNSSLDETELKSNSSQVETELKSTLNALSTNDRLSSIDNLSSISTIVNEVIDRDDSNDGDNDSDCNDSGSYHDDYDGAIPCYPTVEEMDEAWKEHDELLYQQRLNTRVSCDVDSEDASIVKQRYSNEELLDLAGNRVLQRIWAKYQQIGKPVSYTRKNAEKELQLEANQFYGATKYLVSIGALLCNKVVLADGHSIFSYTPLAKSTEIAKRQVVLPEVNIKQLHDIRLEHVLKYYKEHPFNYDESWGNDDLIENNIISLNMLAQDLEKQQIKGTPEDYGDMLFILIGKMKRDLNLEPAPANKNE